MFQAIRRRLTFANVAVTLALVFAMSGGALAAKHYIITSTSQIKPSVLKSLTGKAGPAGPAGTPGAQGLQGPQGLPGLNGKEGPAGKEGGSGVNGSDGQPGAKGATGPAGPTGPAGFGATGPNGVNGTTGPAGLQGVTGAAGPTGPEGPTGPAGPTGPEGVCAKANCTLPSGVTETGTWSADMAGVTFEENVPFAISFPIQLPEKITKVFYFNASQTENNEFKASGCGANKQPGVKPEAPTGTLCVYTEEELGQHHELGEFTFYGPQGQETAGVAGTILKFTLTGTAGSPASIFAHGTWAVTAN